MNTKSKLYALPFALVLAISLAASAVSSRAQSATANIFGVQNGGVYDYTVTLDNTSSGSTALESFWYGWTTSGNNLPSNPSSPANSLGWANNLDGTSIQFVGSSLNALAAGQTATFTFVSSSTPAQMTALGVGTSVAYTGGIESSPNTPNFTPLLVTVPEPSTIGLLALGSVGLLAANRRRFFA